MKQLSWGSLIGFGLGLIIFAGQVKAGIIVLAAALMLAVTQKAVQTLGPCKGIGVLMTIAAVAFMVATATGHHVTALVNLAGLLALTMGLIHYTEKGKA